MVNTEGTAKCYIVNKQRNGMERFLAAAVPFAVEDENFMEAENGNELAAPVAAPPRDFVALMGAMLDKKMEAQSAGIRNDIHEKMKAQSAGMYAERFTGGSSSAGESIGKVFE